MTTPHYRKNFIVMFLVFLTFFAAEDLISRKIQANKESRLREQPSTEFFFYKSVEPVYFNYEIGEDLEFASTSVIHKQGEMHWNDILRCRQGDRYTFYSVYNSSIKKINPDILGREQTKTWIYQSNTPNKPTECFLDTTITFITEDGYTKNQSITSGPFNFK